MSRFRRRLMALSTLKPHIKDEFVRVEYLQGDGVSYIDTGIICSNDSKVELKAKINNNTIVNGMFGSRIYVNQLSRCFYLYSLNTPQVQFGFNNTGRNVNTETSAEHTYIIEKNGCYIDGVKVLDVSNAPFVCPSSVLLFSCHTGSNGLNVESRMMTGRINYCKIWNSNVLVRDFIPVLNKTTDEYGMYDLVEQKFYVSPNGAKFVGGREIIYDAEIEYLESTGTQWIDTGVYHNEGQSYAIDIIATPTKGETDFISTRVGDGGMVVGFYNYFVFGYNRPNSRIDTQPLEVKETELHIEYEFKDGNRTLTVNGISYSKEGATYSANSTIRIYGGYQEVYYSSIKCKRVVFRDANNNLLIDMIPVRVGQVGYMYDKVSGELFGNDGSGSFILGQDTVVYDKI